MIDSDFGQFSMVWNQACIGTGREPDANAVEWAFEVLKDKSLADIKTALIKHARNPDSGQFMPKPADVIREIDGSAQDRKNMAVLAWARVIENVSRYDSVVFDDPAIHYAIAVAFGSDWNDVCNFEESKFEDQDKKRAFIAAHSMFKQGMNYPPRFAGLHEMEGVDYKKCLRIVGDRDKARLVHQGGSHSGLSALNSESTLKAIMIDGSKSND